jgi:hypothetical protein
MLAQPGVRLIAFAACLVQVCLQGLDARAQRAQLFFVLTGGDSGGAVRENQHRQPAYRPAQTPRAVRC